MFSEVRLSRILLRFLGWERASSSVLDSSSGTSPAFKVPAWNQRVDPFEWVDLSSWATSSIHRHVSTAGHLTCLCHGFHCKWRKLVPTSQSCWGRLCEACPGSCHQSKLVGALSCPTPYSTMFCAVEGVWQTSGMMRQMEEKNFRGRRSPGLQHGGEELYYQANFVHKGDLPSFCTKDGCAWLGPRDKIEAVDNFPRPDLWCYFEIYLKFQRKNSISKIYDLSSSLPLLLKEVFWAKE